MMKILLATVTLLVCIGLYECKSKLSKDDIEIIEGCKREKNYKGSAKHLLKDKNERDEKTKYCTIGCIFAKKGILFANNSLNVDKLESFSSHYYHIPKEGVNKIIEMYNHNVTKVSDNCQSAKILFTSFINYKNETKTFKIKVKQALKECTNDTNNNSSSSKYSKYLLKTIMERRDFTEQRDVCTLACLNLKLGIMFANNTLNVDKFKSALLYFKLPNVSKIVTNCNNATKGISNKCEAAKSLYKCSINLR